uniref:Uncharacterized protein n=1 Tax=Pavo cristatus TaxID=9049 RepID=A0A8C9FXW1_PAVCR
FFFSLGVGCSFPTCLVNQDPEQASTPGGLNSTCKNENHLFPAKPLRDSQSHLLTDTHSWSDISAKAEKGKVGKELTYAAMICSIINYLWQIQMTVVTLFVFTFLTAVPLSLFYACL